MSKKTHSQICTQIMESFIADGLKDVLLKGTADQASEKIQTLIEALTFVQARLVSSYLMKLLQEGDDNQFVATMGDMIVQTTNQLFENSVADELSRMVDQLEDIVKDITSKGQTSH